MKRGWNSTRRQLLRSCGSLGVIGLAGCVSDIGTEANPSDNSDSNDETGSEREDIDFPPGVSESGIDDAAALVDAHRSAVMETSFTYESAWRIQETDETTGESTTINTNSVEIRAEPNAERLAKTEYDGSVGEDIDEGLYKDGDRSATTDGRPVVESVEEVLETSLETGMVDEVDGEYVGTKTLDDVTVHEISVTEIELELTADPNDEEGTMSIDEDGRIHRFEIAQTGDTQSVEHEFEFSEFGTTTVEKPEWVDELKETQVIEPGTTIELGARTVSWVGDSPSTVAGVENPTLVLRAGEQYTIEWRSESGVHNLVIYDDTQAVVNGLRTEQVDESSGDQTLTFEASTEMAEYGCEPHYGAGMYGDIEVR